MRYIKGCYGPSCDRLVKVHFRNGELIYVPLETLHPKKSSFPWESLALAACISILGVGAILLAYMVFTGI